MPEYKPSRTEIIKELPGVLRENLRHVKDAVASVDYKSPIAHFKAEIGSMPYNAEKALYGLYGLGEGMMEGALFVHVFPYANRRNNRGHGIYRKEHDAKSDPRIGSENKGIKLGTGGGVVGSMLFYGLLADSMPAVLLLPVGTNLISYTWEKARDKVLAKNFPRAIE